MNKCQNCGAFVAVEKAFCPNCSEPMEPEEAPNRAHSFSSEMLATIRDDPEKYRQMLVTPPKKKTEEPIAQTPAPPSIPVAMPPQPTDYSTPTSWPTAPPTTPSGEKNYLFVIVGIVVLLILVFIILYAFKVI